MNLEENELKIAALEEKLLNLKSDSIEFSNVKKEIENLKNIVYTDLSAWDRVCIARGARRIKAYDLVQKLFSNFFELKGDQYYGEDSSILSGLGFLGDIPVTILAQAKGRNINENIKRNFGMTSPEGFRKTLRLAKQAEKFKRPIITIVDTSGAYPGKGAEERGQARAIAENLMEFSRLSVPILSIVLSEGGSGGALALTVSDYIFMFENAVYSVLSPEGFASILFKNTENVKDVCDLMKLTSKDLKDFKIIDEIIEEPLGGIKYLDDDFIRSLKQKLINKIQELTSKKANELLTNRYEKFRRIGEDSGN